ncbi:SusC/RagA family TonB-linked outer membrane protein [Negadavirga shengliensis]|uniref:SusC/RagA family TonB-linked outer membrane protein n=1 Tax=Negadavirga shengliensis TaxID=1389218 RepID=A0ABV9T0K9_9BACT
MEKRFILKLYFAVGCLFLSAASHLSQPVLARALDVGLLEQSERTVQGKVTTSEGEALPGVSVMIKESSSGTVTDVEGNYRMNIPDQNAILVFSYIGYKSEEIAVGNQATINVSLSLSDESLDEVVVIGYGSVRKSDLTGSVVSVKEDELKAIPATTFDQALQGRAAGVQVVQASGTPGGETNIRIRGTSSINASSEPLYVIDGMLINSNGDEMSIGGRGPRIGALATINPSEIESIEVLKDASATAIYGSRGANGVILITTKRGKEGVGTVNLESYYGVQQVSRKLDLLDASQFAQLVNEASINANRNPVYVNPANLGRGTDWQEELFRTAPITSHQLSFTGGDERTKYAVSGGYFNQDGIIIGSDFERYSFRTNLDREISKKLTVGTSLSYNNMASNGVLTGPGQIVPGVITNALQFNPVLPVYDASRPGGYTFQHDRKDAVANPVAEAKEYQALTQSSRVLGNFYANYTFMENLEFRTSFGIDALHTKSNTFGPNFLKRTENSKGEASVSALQAMTWLNENTLSYKREINENNHFDVLLGYTMQHFRNESVSAVAFDFPDNRTGYHNLDAALNPQRPTNMESEWSMVSYLGRVNYTLNDRYLFTLSGRIDASSKFATGNKYGFFPSGAFAWRVSDEQFMADAGFVSDLKLRASYGLIGNQAIPPYQSLALVGPFGQGVFNNPTGIPEVIAGQEPLSYPNRDLRWESTEQANLGLDLAVLDHRLMFTAEVYHKNTFDLLLSTPIPYTTGFGNTLLNIGNVRNRGLDIEVRSVNTTGKLAWNTSLNFSINRNRILNLAREEDILLGVGGNILRENEPIGSFYGYVFDGIFQTDEEAQNSPVLRGQEPTSPNPASRAQAGDRRYRDISGPNGVPDGIIDEYDRTIIGSAEPDFIWGINNDLTYKNFNLSFFFQGSQGNQMVNMNLVNLENFNGQQNLLAEAGLNRWTPENPSNRYPRALSDGSLDNVFSSRFVEDASYIRLRNVMLSYNFPFGTLSKIGVRNLRVYVSGTNLLTFTKYSGYNPEGNAYGATTNIVGVDDGIYPLAKTYIMGLNFGF